MMEEQGPYRGSSTIFKLEKEKTAVLMDKIVQRLNIWKEQTLILLQKGGSRRARETDKNKFRL